MLQVFQRHRAELGVEASPLELQLAVSETRRQLGEDSARLSLGSLTRADGRLEAVVTIDSRVGHKLPTAYPSRRAWVEFTVRDADGDVVFSSGALAPTGAITGNDNDAGSDTWEPHYERISSSGQVQINTAMRFLSPNRSLRNSPPAASENTCPVPGSADPSPQRRTSRTLPRRTGRTPSRSGFGSPLPSGPRPTDCNLSSLRPKLFSPSQAHKVEQLTLVH